MGAGSTASVLSEIADTASCGCSSAEEIRCQCVDVEETCCPDVARMRNARLNRIQKEKIIAFSHAEAFSASTRTTSADDKGFDAGEGQSECERSGNDLRPIRHRLLKWQTTRLRSSLLRGAPQTFDKVSHGVNFQSASCCIPSLPPRNCFSPLSAAATPQTPFLQRAEGVPSSVHPQPVAELIWGGNVFRVTEKNSEQRYSVEKSTSPDSNDRSQSVPKTPLISNTR